MENKFGCSKPFSISIFIRQLITIRIAGALFIIGWNIVWTSLIMCFIKYVLRIPLRMSEEELLAGSNMVHGESAYVLGPCEAHEQLLAGQYIKRSDTLPADTESGGVIVGKNPHAEKGSASGSGNGVQEIKLD